MPATDGHEACLFGLLQDLVDRGTGCAGKVGQIVLRQRHYEASPVAPEHIDYLQKPAQDASVCRHVEGLDHLRAEVPDLDREGVGQEPGDGWVLAAQLLKGFPADHPGLDRLQRARSGSAPAAGQEEGQLPEEVTAAQDGKGCDIAEWGRDLNLDEPLHDQVKRVSGVVLVKDHLVAIKRSPGGSLQKARSGNSVQAF
jgi:hypothetical protein